MMSLQGVAYICTRELLKKKKRSLKKVFKITPLIFDFSGSILHINEQRDNNICICITAFHSQDFMVLNSGTTNIKGGGQKDSKIPA